MYSKIIYCLFVISAIISASPAQADEIFAGIGSQDIATPLAQDTGAEGVDFQLGYRGDPIEALSFIAKPSPYVLASVNSSGDTSFAAVGLSWKFGEKIYLRPGIGIAIHDGPELAFAPDGSQTQLGSRILFEPELAVGVRLSQRVDLEVSWVHLSHGQVFSRVQNPGIDSVGMRLVIKLP
ncbi:MAG: acyloxyacyl hydrolase [Parasphingorhabdus sp.]